MLEKGGFGVGFGRKVQAGVIPPYPAVPMVTWAMEKSWEEESRKVFDFINGLCHHVTFLSPPFSASLLHVLLLALGEGAKHLKEQPNRLSTTLGHRRKTAASAVETADVARSSKRSFPFRATQVSVDSGIRADLAAKWHKVWQSCTELA